MSKPYKIPQSTLVVIYTPGLQVLLIRRADTPDEEFWQSVTGSKDDADESFAQAAAREVQEETGISCGPHTALARIYKTGAWKMCIPYTPAGCIAIPQALATIPNVFLG